MTENKIVTLMDVILSRADLIYVLVMTSTLFGNRAQCKLVNLLSTVLDTCYLCLLITHAK